MTTAKGARWLKYDVDKMYETWLAHGQNYKETGLSMGLGKNGWITVRRYAIREGFHERYNRDIERASPHIVKAARQLAYENLPKAVNTLSECLDAPKASWRDKVLAAKAMLEIFGVEPSKEAPMSGVLIQMLGVSNVQQLDRNKLMELAQGNLEDNITEASARKA